VTTHPRRSPLRHGADSRGSYDTRFDRTCCIQPESIVLLLAHALSLYDEARCPTSRSCRVCRSGFKSVNCTPSRSRIGLYTSLRTGWRSGREGEGGQLQRQWMAHVATLLVLVIVAGGVIAAANAEGPIASQFDSNDGGAWLVNGSQGAVGHVNRAVREYTTPAVSIATPGADLLVTQAKDVVAVHDQSSGTVVLVDDRLARIANETVLPEGAEIAATPGGLVVVDSSGGRAWWFDRVRLSEIGDVEEDDPMLAVDSPITFTVARNGVLRILESGTLRTWRLQPNGPKPSLVEDDVFAGQGVEPFTGTPVLSTSGDRLVVLDRTSGTLYVDTEDGMRRFDVGEEWNDASLQQPSDDTDTVVAIWANGAISSLSTAGGSQQMVASMEAMGPLRPINVGECTYGVATDPPTFARFCNGGDLEKVKLPSSASRLVLRLVNGSVWINDRLSGQAWFAPPDGELQQVDDWGVALGTENFAINESTESGIESEEEELVEDPDVANAEIVSADRQTDEDGENDPPIAHPDIGATRPDRPVEIDVIANDEDPDGDVLLVSFVEDVDPNRGRAFAAADRKTLQFNPAPGFTGRVEFGYAIDDGRGGTSSSTVVVDVVPLDRNEAPIAVTDIAATRSGSPVKLNVLINDLDPEGDPLVLLDVIAPQGSVTFTSDGQVVFFPVVDTDQARVELTYTIADIFGATAEGILRVSVRPSESNNEPDARNDSAVGVVGSPISFNVLDNDYDADGDVLTVIRPPDDPRIRLTTDGELFFLPDEPGVFLFTYVISDGSESDTAQVRIDVMPAGTNRPPVASRDDIAIARGGFGTVYVLENDGDPDGDVVSIVDWITPEGLSVELIESRSLRVGTSLNASPTMTIRYAISDGINDPVWSSILVTVTDVSSTNQAPIPGDDYVEIRQGVPTLIDVLANDVDPDGDGLSIRSVSSTPRADVVVVGTQIRVSLDDETRGGFAFTYDVVDTAGNSSSGTVTVRVVLPTEPNRAPVARTDIVRTPEGTWIVVDVISNDSDPDGDPIVVVVTSQPANGTVSQVDYRSIRYTPDPGFIGTDSFEYVIEDVHGDQARGAVIIGVAKQSETNRAPTANDDRVSVAEGRDNIVIAVLANDSDPDGDRLVITRVTQPRDGSVQVGSGDQVLVLAPDPDAALGSELTFVYDVQDGRGGSASAVVSVRITESGEPAPPVAVDDLAGPVAPGTILEIPVLANDLDPDGNAAALHVSSDDPAVTVLPNRSARIVAPAETTRYWYTVTDVDGLASTGVIVVFVVDNEPPVVDSTQVETLQNVAVEIELTDSTTDPDGDPLLFICCDNVRNGLAEVLSETESELTVRFMPNSGFIGTAGFAYRVDDRQGHVVSATVVIKVVPPANTPPDVGAAAADVEAGGVTVLDLTAFGKDADGDALSLVSVGDPSGDQINVQQNGNTAVITANIKARDAKAMVDFVLSDGEDEAEGSLSITVIATTKEPPSAQPDTEGNAINQGESITLDVLANDIDPLGEGLSIVSASVTPAGAVSVGVDGADLSFQPNIDFFGTATFTYTIQDVTATVERESSAQVQVDVIGRPAVPQKPAVVEGNAQIVITWQTPPGNGAPIDEYELRSSTGETISVGLTNGYTWSSLTNGQPYSYDVRAHNNAGWSEWSEVSAEATPDTLPEVPAAPSLAFGDQEITVSWTAPYNEGSAITSYLLQSSDGVRIDVGNITEYTWTGLSNGTAYTFQVAAVNAAGATVFGPASAPETPAREPEAPDAPTGTRGSTVVDLIWSEPVLNGAPILEYEVRINPGATSTSVGTATSYSWASLPNGVSVTFDVRGRNKAGWGLWSADSIAVTPCGVPDPIGAPGAVRGDLQATVSWISPNPQGCRVTQYEIVSSTGGSQFAPGEIDIASIGVPNTLIYPGLTNGTTYTFQVRALNEVGWSPLSPSSPAVVPAGPPGVAVLSASPTGVGQITLAWSTPGDNGSPIIRYEVSINGGVPRSVTSSPYNWTGLGNGTAYSFRVRAINDVGPGGWSAAVGATTWGPPSQVGGLAVSAGNAQLTASWTAPAANGTRIIDYEVDIQPGGAPRTTARSYTFTGLTNGTGYNIRVRARNAVGSGAWSGLVGGTPSAPKVVSIAWGANAGSVCSSGLCLWINIGISGFSGNTSYDVACYTDNWSTAIDHQHGNYGLWRTQTSGISTNSSGSGSSGNDCYFGYPTTHVRIKIGGVWSNELLR